MYKRLVTAVPLLLLSVTVSAGSPKAPPSHCKPGEKEIFSCQIKKSENVASVCRSGQFLAYRFGKLGSTQVAYPEGSVRAAKVFKFTSQESPMTNYKSLEFVRQGVTYSIVDDSGSADISVARDPKNPKSKLNESLPCGRVRANWDGIFDLNLPPAEQ